MNMENHILGGYRIERKLGEGGMGAVYRATQMRLERTVALKVMSPALAANHEITIRFLREGQTIAALDHPNILPVYEAGEAHLDTGEGPFSYLAMRYVAGGTLRDLILREGKLKPSRALYFLEQAAAGLQTAHNHGYIHRDIKPANLLLDPSVPGQRGEHLSIADFGIVKTTGDTDTFKTSTGAVIGTPIYMAPEQLQGKPVDSRADIYALTIVLYEMLKGEVPFQAETPALVIFRKMSEPPPAFNAVELGLSPAIDAVIARGLALQPDQRFATPMELVEAFRQALAAPATAVVHTAAVEWPASLASDGHHAATAPGAVTRPPGQPAAGQPTMGAATQPTTTYPSQPNVTGQTTPPPLPPATTQTKQPMPMAYVIGMVVLGMVVILLTGALVFTQLGDDDDDDHDDDHAPISGVLDPTSQATPEEGPAEVVGTAQLEPPAPPAEPEPTPPPPDPTAPPPPTEPSPPAEPPIAEAGNEQPQPDGRNSAEPSPPIDEAQLDAVFDNAGGTFGVVIYHVDNEAQLYTRNADQTFPSAGLIRLPIAMAAYALAEQGEISLDDQVTLEQSDIVAGSGGIQNDPPGTSYTVRDLSTRMIAESDNTAANLLTRYIGGTARVNEQMQDLGASQTQIRQRIIELDVMNSGRGSVTTPDDMVLLLLTLERAEIADGRDIVQAMESNQNREEMPTGLPQNFRVATITSAFEGGVNNIALVETPSGHRFILAILSSDVPDNQTSVNAMAEAASLIFMQDGSPGSPGEPPTAPDGSPGSPGEPPNPPNGPPPGGPQGPNGPPPDGPPAPGTP